VGRIAVEGAADQHEPVDQVGPAHGNPQRHGRAGTVADQTHRSADQLVQEGDGVPGHHLERDWPCDVGGVAVTPAFRKEEPKPAGQGVEVAGEVPAVGDPAVQQHHRVTLAALVVPHRDAVHVHVGCHRVTIS
jgi:hypothetical protein